MITMGGYARDAPLNLSEYVHQCELHKKTFVFYNNLMLKRDCKMDRLIGLKCFHHILAYIWHDLSIEYIWQNRRIV